MTAPDTACKVISNSGAACPNPVPGNADYCWSHGDWFHADLEVYRMVDEHFRQDVREFWQRGNFFIVVEALLLSAFSIQSTSARTDSLVAVTLAVFGLVLTVAWFSVMRTSLGWIRKWRAQRARLSRKLDRYGAHAALEADVRSNSRRSPTAITTYIPILFGATWAVLLTAILFR